MNRRQPLTLHRYQGRGIEFILERKSVYLAVDLGLGKTAITLEAISRIGCPALVLAPLRVIYSTWPEEIVKWTPHLNFTILHGRQKDDRIRHKVDIYLLNYDGLPWFYRYASAKKFEWTKSALVLDEASFVKSHQTKRFKLLNMMRPLFNEYRIALSATPAPNGYQDLWSQYYLLDQGESLGKSFYSFRAAHFNYSGPPVYKTTLRPGQGEAIQERVRPCTFRLDASDYLELPPVSYPTIDIELSAGLMKQYRQLEKDFFIQLADEGITAYNAAALSMKLRQFIQGALYTDQGDGSFIELHQEKVKALAELVEGSAGQPILCPIQFKFELAMLRKKFGADVPVIAGGTNADDSNRYISMWNSGRLPLLLCHPASLGHGVNLQAGGHIVCWYALTWSLEHYLQLNGRLRRQGQRHAVVVHHLIARGTIDEVLMNIVVGRKQATQQGFLDALRSRMEGLFIAETKDANRRRAFG